MKKLVLFAAILMVSLFSLNTAKAQVSLNINIGAQPAWGPTGYDHVDYYYLPDINTYYYVPTRQYIYQNGNRWVTVNSLPAQYRNFDLYRSYKVVVNEPKPYLRNNIYISKYGKYKNYSGHQNIIRDSRDAKYYVVKGHPNYNSNKTVVVNKRPVHTQKTVVRVERNNQPYRDNDRGNKNANGNRPERNNSDRGNRRG